MDEEHQDPAEGYFEYMRAWSKRYLGRVRAAVRAVEMARSEIAELESMMDGLGAVDYSRDSVSQQADDEGMIRRIERMDSLRAELADELDRSLQAQADARRALSHVRQPWRAVLTCRYLYGMKWADIAELTGYGTAYCKSELHENGLLELYPHIPHEYDALPDAV